MQINEYQSILDYLRRLIACTEWEGHVFAVGGCCRDYVLGCEIKDIDLAVDLPDGGIGFAKWLHGRGLTSREPVTFPSFGTAMLKLNEFPDREIEIVQTRREKYTPATRGNPAVVFGTKEEDCLRRDLTINALYYDISRGQLLDLLGCSIDDIHNHIIRTPDDPVRTFDDDPVRILRTIRFATRYGWQVNEETIEGMRVNAPLLKHIRPERRQAEIEKILCGNDPARAMRLILKSNALPHTFPELCTTVHKKQNFRHNDTMWEHSLEVLSKVPPMPILRWAALYHGLGSRLPVVNAMRRYHYDKEAINKVAFLVTHHNDTKKWGARCENMTDSDLRHLQHTCAAPERLRRLLMLIEADNTSYAPEYCMPEQTMIISKRSDELRKAGLAAFGFYRTLSNKQIRQIKGIRSNAKIEVYRNFLTGLLIDNPKLDSAELTRRLETFTPKEKSKKRNWRRRRKSNKHDKRTQSE